MQEKTNLCRPPVWVDNRPHWSNRDTSLILFSAVYMFFVNPVGTFLWEFFLPKIWLWFFCQCETFSCCLPGWVHNSQDVAHPGTILLNVHLSKGNICSRGGGDLRVRPFLQPHIRNVPVQLLLPLSPLQRCISYNLSFRAETCFRWGVVCPHGLSFCFPLPLKDIGQPTWSFPCSVVFTVITFRLNRA